MSNKYLSLLSLLKSKLVHSKDDDIRCAMREALKEVTGVCAVIKTAVRKPETLYDTLRTISPEFSIDNYPTENLRMVQSLEEVLEKMQQANNMPTEKWTEVLECARNLKQMLLMPKSAIERCYHSRLIEGVTDLEEAMETAYRHTPPRSGVPQPKQLNVQMD
jgi:hypothetical protein